MGILFISVDFFQLGMWKAAVPWTERVFSSLGTLKSLPSICPDSLRIGEKQNILPCFSSWLSFDELSLQKSVLCTGPQTTRIALPLYKKSGLTQNYETKD